jgi:putative sugar O-methyltransferase
MWDEINKIYFVKNSFDLSNFRSQQNLNSRLASWEPNEKSVRWFRSFLNLAFNSSSDGTKEILDQMSGKTNLGNPITNFSNWHGKKIEYNLDYLIAVEEFTYLRNYVSEVQDVTVLEIGAGFGRTAHVILEYLKEVKSYFIYDLPEMLTVSAAYLEKQLPAELFRKLVFTSNFEQLIQKRFTIGIQIDGFQEMSTDVIDVIYANLIESCDLVYLKNPVGKYHPSAAGLEIPLSAVPLALGRSQDLLDIWNPADLEPFLLKHAEVYRPNLYEIVNFTPERLFAHYLNVIYQKNESKV